MADIKYEDIEAIGALSNFRKQKFASFPRSLGEARGIADRPVYNEKVALKAT